MLNSCVCTEVCYVVHVGIDGGDVRNIVFVFLLVFLVVVSIVTYFFRCSRNVISSAAILQHNARREWPFGHFVLIKCLFNRLL